MSTSNHMFLFLQILMSVVNKPIAAANMLSAQIMMGATHVHVLLDMREMESSAVSASIQINIAFHFNFFPCFRLH